MNHTESPSPNAPSADDTVSAGALVGALHATFGQHRARAVHAKGLVLEGQFSPAPSASELTVAAHLQTIDSQVIVRFSNFTGLPQISDSAAAANPRGLAIKFTLPDASTTDVIAHSFNGFPTRTSAEFRLLLLAIGASGPGAKKPTALDGFLETHPIAKTFLTTQKLPASFGSLSYFGVNSFTLTNSAGRARFVRYQFVPVDGEEQLSPEQYASASEDYLFEELLQRVQERVLKFRYYAQLAEPEDVIENPSVAWPDARRRVLLGELRIEKLARNTTADDQALAFHPNNLPAGIEPADPMLGLRSKAYPISVRERQ